MNSHITQTDQDRSRLGFAAAVRLNFGFLRDFGMVEVHNEPTLVRYESDCAFVNVYHGRGSYVIGVDIGRRDRTVKYGLDYIVSFAGKEAWDREGFGRSTMFQVSSFDGVQQFVPKVAELVKTYGSNFLRGDPDFYDRLAEDDKSRAIEWAKNRRIEQVREEADAAWTNKDFARVAELYQSIAATLNNMESKRLAYATKHSSR